MPRVPESDPELPRDERKYSLIGMVRRRMRLRRLSVRTEEAIATGADAIAVACPFCMTMMADSIKSRDSHVEVYDVAEVVAGRLAV